MTARTVTGVEAARTAPVVVLEAEMIITVFPVEVSLEVTDLHSLRLVLIALGLLNLADHARVHGCNLQFD